MPKITHFNQQPDLPKLEEETLQFWQETQAFEKSVEMRSPDKSYVFYDGPPFATGMPHYGHLLASTTKDVIPRYWTMKGYRVERVWGWDCHGLPIENMIEQKLEIKGGKKGIEELGIDKFNDACRREVLRLDQEWEKIIGRLGRWVDFKHNYKTMDKTFMESVWWGFKQLVDKDLTYEGRKIVLFCPRCSTPLSNFEIAMDNSYKDVQDNSVYVKFKLTGKTNEYLVAWTTTPWTLPGNVALAVDPEARYSQVKVGDDVLWLASARLEATLTETKYEVLNEVPGKELVNREYEPLFDYFGATEKKGWYVLPGNFVSLEDGTGIVHTAALFGEDDYALALQYDLPLIPTLNDEGKFLPFVELVAGQFYKKAEAPIMADLERRGLLLRAEKITHSYPFCYRCGTPLYYNAVPAWFINVQQLKAELVAQNEHINWYPEHLKHGRFGKGLENAPDWNISRSRYWGTPMPVWQGDGHQRVIGSLAELKDWAVKPEDVDSLTDIHREFLDHIEVWVDDARTVKGTRIPEVFDCWVESGSMPFAAIHYPFENKAFFDQNYPAQFVSEYIAQTRAWFYTMHVLSVGIFGKHPFENVLTTGTILAEDGSKMSKSKKNYPDPMVLIDKYGVDSLRLYLMSSTVMKGENLNFSEKEVADLRRKVFVIWWNVFAFYQQYADTSADFKNPPAKPTHVMDQWLLARVNRLIKEVTEYMDGYDVVRTSRVLIEFVDELSTWYLRLSRDRLKGDHRHEMSQVFGYALYTLAQLFAPLSPYFPELVHHTMVDETTSIHHTDWPTVHTELLNETLENAMTEVKKVVEQGRAMRTDLGVKLRQPLSRVSVTSAVAVPSEALLEVIKQELNVKHITWAQGAELAVQYDTTVTPELKAEGEARELMRSIQQLRRKAGLQVDDVVTVEALEWPSDWQTEIETKTKTKLVRGSELRIV